MQLSKKWGKSYYFFCLRLPVYHSGFTKVWDLSIFYNILYHRFVLNPSYKTDLNDLITKWLLSDQLQCNSILLVCELPTLLKNVYKYCLGACENRYAFVSSFEIRVKSKCFLPGQQKKKKKKSKLLSLRTFVEMLKLLLMGDIQFQVSKTNFSAISNEETFFLMESKQSSIWPLMKTQGC